MNPNSVDGKREFFYQNIWGIAVGLTLSFVFFIAGLAAILSKQPGTLVGGTVCVAASFSMVCLLLYGLVLRSKFSISEIGLTWTLLGIQWRIVRWEDIKIINESITWSGLGPGGGGNFRNKVNISLSRRFIVKTKKKFRIIPIIFRDDMDNFPEWRKIVSQYVDKFGISVVGSLRDRDDEGLQ
jgi:hypothetical protein